MIIKIFKSTLLLCCSLDEITASFRRFGPLIVDWPHKAESKSYFPPKGNSQDSICMYSLFLYYLMFSLFINVYLHCKIFIVKLVFSQMCL